MMVMIMKFSGILLFFLLCCSYANIEIFRIRIIAEDAGEARRRYFVMVILIIITAMSGVLLIVFGEIGLGEGLIIVFLILASTILSDIYLKRISLQSSINDFFSQE